MRPALCVCCLIAVSQAVSAQTDIESFVDSLIRHQLEARRIAGAVVTVVDDGAVVFSKGYGDADIALRRPMVHDTLVRIASVTKTFTALAVMQLVEDGKLDLDRDVNEYLDFTVPPMPGRSSVTLRRLLSHQSGFEDRPGDIGAWRGGRLPLGPYLARHMPPRLPQADDVVSYSNYNAALAAYIVERASGEPFERYLENHLFRPLQMTRTTAVQPVPDALLALVSSGYVRSDVPPTPLSMAAATIYEAGSTGIVSSGGDMARLMLALLDADPKIVSRATLDAMMAGQTTVPVGVVGLGLVSPLSAGGNAFIGHDGGTGGFQSTLALLPQERFGIFASYNSEGIQERVSAAGELLARVAERYFAGVGLQLRASPAGDVAGVYQFTRRVESNIFRIRSLLDQAAVRSENGRLTIRPAMLPFGEPLDEIGPGLFRWAGRDVSFAGSGASARMQVGSSVGQFLRVPWWANAGIVIPIVFICGIVAAGSVLAWPVSFLRRRSVDSDALARRLWTATRLALFLDLIAIGAALWLVFGARPLIAFSSPSILHFGATIYATAWAGVLLTPLTVWYAAGFMRKSHGSRWARTREALLVVVHVILVAFCLYWRIAGTTLAF